MLKIDLTALDTWDTRYKIWVFCGLCCLVLVCGYALLVANVQLRLNHQQTVYARATRLLQAEQRRWQEDTQRLRALPMLQEISLINSPPLKELKQCNITDFEWHKPTLIMALQYEQAICVLKSLTGTLQKMQLSHVAANTLTMQLDFKIKESE